MNLKTNKEVNEEFKEKFNLAFQGNHSIKYYGGLIEKWIEDFLHLQRKEDIERIVEGIDKMFDYNNPANDKNQKVQKWSNDFHLIRTLLSNIQKDL